MDVTETNIMSTDDPVQPIAAALSCAHESAESLKAAKESLLHLAESARDASRAEAGTCAELFAKLLTIAGDAQRQENASVVDAVGPIVDFVEQRLPILRAVLIEDNSAEIEAIVDDANERWHDWMDLVDDPSWDADTATSDWECSTDAESEPTDFVEEENDPVVAEIPSESDIASLLSAVTSLPEIHTSATQEAPTQESRETLADAADNMDDIPVDSSDIDGELLEAFRDDASRCLSGMEEAALAFEANPVDQQPLNQICRELHTLKGAAASVGWDSLAAYMHKVEDSVRDSCESGQAQADVQSILATVDSVRNRVTQLAGPQDATPGDGSPAEAAAPARPMVTLDQTSSDGEETIRVKAAQLDRLLDMLAQLVMLRNRRDSRVDELKSSHGELIRCVTRLRSLNEGIIAQNTASQPSTFPVSAQGSNSLTELANDVLEVAHGLRELYEPVAEENREVSRFIREFRQELMQLSRLPIGGLFQRLQRSVRDAARAEGKQVRLERIGESTGLDRSLQERLYEPLLHIVRNAVSHGIESESKRAAAGKDPVGTVTIEARGGTNQLVIEVRDDGAGLDFEGIRRRGRELGLLADDRAVTHQELSQLIFHPGFSTRKTVGSVAGRGVGMDVVATALERMRSWIEVESTPGQGTRIRLYVPLRSVIEHSMVFRSCGQLFAVPLRCVHGAGDWNADSNSATSSASGKTTSATVDCAELLGLQREEHCESPQALILDGHRRTTGDSEMLAETGSPSAESRQQVVLVDEIVGPEEVVVRPLPPLLRQQPLFGGVTLAGTGEIVLLLDGQHLCELALNGESAAGDRKIVAATPSKTKAESDTVLVVDDSLSARRAVAQVLERRNYRVTEAADGIEAMDRVRDQLPSMILTDLEMPRRNGFDLLQELKSDTATAAIPVVMISSRQEAEIRQRARDLGALSYLTKPFREEELAGLLEQIHATGATEA